jgi:hypothetical protein
MKKTGDDAPADVAALMSASADAAHFVGAVKRIWPGAVVNCLARL